MRHAAVLLALMVAGTVGAEPSYRYAYIRHVDGEVTLHRAMDSNPESASLNFPIMAGDRVWTGGSDRAEIEFADGSLLRIDERTKVDFTEFEEGLGRETLLRQWSGAVILRVAREPADRGGRFRVDTPAGSIFSASTGLFRVDVQNGDTVSLSVHEGVAELATEYGSVLVRSGQRGVARIGERPERPFSFNTAQWDGFDEWSDRRESRSARTRYIEGIPEEVAPFVDDLDDHGSWRYDASYGHVWYPRVGPDWYPYGSGRWAYTPFGWTWCSYEPWGWAPYHYGRWGYGGGGWYWIPASYWGPAWVSWAIGPSWVGWCPLGYYDRPVIVLESVYRGGRAVPRGHARTGWSFARSAELGESGASRARLRADDVRGDVARARILDSGAILERDLTPRVVGAAAMTRAPRTTASPGVASEAGETTRRGTFSERGRIFREVPDGGGAVRARVRPSEGTAPEDTTPSRVPSAGSETEERVREPQARRRNPVGDESPGSGRIRRRPDQRRNEESRDRGFESGGSAAPPPATGGDATTTVYRAPRGRSPGSSEGSSESDSRRNRGTVRSRERSSSEGWARPERRGGGNDSSPARGGTVQRNRPERPSGSASASGGSRQQATPRKTKQKDR